MQCRTFLGALALNVAFGVSDHDIDFDAYTKTHGRSYRLGTEEYETRRAIFNRRLEAIQEQNSRPQMERHWRAGVNHLTDRSEQELAKLRGWRHLSGPRSGGSFPQASASLLQASAGSEKIDDADSDWETELPKKMSWAHLDVSGAKDGQEHFIRDQGMCGSCWAITAAALLEAHREISQGVATRVSPQHMVNCVQNPKKCGGDGGCKGATVELGLDYVLNHGIPMESDSNYIGSDQKCEALSGKSEIGATGMFNSGRSRNSAELEPDEESETSFSSGETNEDRRGDRKLLSAGEPGDPNYLESPDEHGVHRLSRSSHGGRIGNSIGLIGWRMLKQNSAEDLSRSLVEHGPIGVSVSGRGWDLYDQGVFNSCSKDAIVDHAVTLYGYGDGDGAVLAQGAAMRPSLRYWLIRNSWGQSWGEKGFIRLQRQKNEDQQCGMDSDAQKGTACEGGPSQVKVCGMCGVLYDSVVPYFAPGPLSKHASAHDETAADDASSEMELQAKNVVTIGADGRPEAIDRLASRSETRGAEQRLMRSEASVPPR